MSMFPFLHGQLKRINGALDSARDADALCQEFDNAWAKLLSLQKSDLFVMNIELSTKVVALEAANVKLSVDLDDITLHS